MTTNEPVGSPEWNDPDDAPVLTEADAREVEVFHGNTFVRRGRGRPKTGAAKELVSIRLDPDVLARLRFAGPGWQVQVNLLLRQVLGLDSATSAASQRPSMSKEIVVAVYDSVAHAEQVVSDLLAANVPQSAISRHAAPAMYSPEATSVATRRPEDQAGGGFWSSLFGGSSDDHVVYDNALQSGGNVVTVATVPEHDYEAVMSILEKHNPVDIDERAAAFSSGMPATQVPMDVVAPGGMMAAEPAPAPATYATTAEQGGVIQLAEESLMVGKRLVNRGGARIRRYVVEMPVEQQVTLHEEKVTLERRPVTDGRPVAHADFTDRTIELTETGEEAVVSKTARVVEEVSLSKTATARTETIRDTVRKEEVEIEHSPGTWTTTSGTHRPKV